MNKAKVILPIAFALILSLWVFPPSVSFGQTPTETPSPSPQNEIRTRVIEKVGQKSAIPTAFLGVVTDLTKDTVQVSAYLTEEIKQITVNEETVYVNSKATTIAFEDLAIGDFLVAMGYSDGNGTLEASRILVTNPLAETKRQAFLGTIKTVEGNLLTISVGEEDLEVNLESRTGISLGKDTVEEAERSSLAEGTRVIVSGDEEENEFVARLVHVLSSNQNLSPSPTPAETE